MTKFYFDLNPILVSVLPQFLLCTFKRIKEHIAVFNNLHSKSILFLSKVRQTTIDPTNAATADPCKYETCFFGDERFLYWIVLLCTDMIEWL